MIRERLFQARQCAPHRKLDHHVMYLSWLCTIVCHAHTASMLHCNITQHRKTQNIGHSSACWQAQAQVVSMCPAAVIPTMACCSGCYRPSHGVPWCGMALSQSVSRDLSPSLPLGRWVGGCTNWDADADLGCIAGPASLQPSWAQTSDGELSRTRGPTTTSTCTFSKVCCKIRRT